jgi:hypothetical protein
MNTKQDPVAQRPAKGVLFDDVYRATPDELATKFGLTEQQVKAIMSSWASRYPGVQA